MAGLIFILVMFLLLWLLLIQPQRRRAKELQRVQEAVKEGDEVLTHSGLYGHVRSVSGDGELHVEIAPGTTVRMDRRAVATVVAPEHAIAAPEPAQAPDPAERG